MTQEKILIQQALFTEAYRTYKKALNVHAFFKVHNPVVCEDLVQDAFVKTWRYLMKGGKIDTMKAFLYHVLNALIIDEYRKRKPISLDILLENGFEPSVDTSEHLFNSIDGKAVVPFLNRLPSKYQHVMHMRYVEDLSLQEMSSLTGQKKNTLAVQINRGLEKLRRIYKK